MQMNNLRIALLLSVVFLISCKEDKQLTTPKKEVEISTQPKIPYAHFKQNVAKEKALLKNEPANKISAFLYDCLNDGIYNYWHKTPWDFNGTSREPQQGTIACGYFVTNTLSDLGFDIQRTKLAQQASSVMIKKLCTDIHYFSSVPKLQEYLNKQPNKSAYIIGLDFHTGYILKDETGSYFLHSNYQKREGVVKEIIAESSNLKSSKSFMIGSLTTNEKLLKQWVKQ